MGYWQESGLKKSPRLAGGDIVSRLNGAPRLRLSSARG
jgi:hypothetical protein